MKELEKIEGKTIDNILQRCKDGDASAFREILKKYEKFAYVLAYRVILNEDDAKDIVQESFIRVWKHIKLFNNQVKFTTWLYRIVINLCYDKLKSKKRKEKVMINNPEYQKFHFDSENNPEKTIDNKQIAEMIENFSKNLTYKQRLVFILRDLQELSVEEVSSILKISASAVKTNLVYARKNIREKMEKYLK